MNHELQKLIYGDGSHMGKHVPMYGIPHEELCSIEDLEAFVQVGKEMEIGVKVLARAGEKYLKTVRTSIEGSGGTPIGESINFSPFIVPEGSVCVSITNEIRRMGEFFRRVDALSERLRPVQK